MSLSVDHIYCSVSSAPRTQTDLKSASLKHEQEADWSRFTETWSSAGNR